LAFKMRLSSAMGRARAIAGTPGFHERLSDPPNANVRSSKRDRLRRANALASLALRTTGDTAARAKGVAFYVAGDCRHARATFETIQRRDARDWNDLAAATMCVARNDKRDDLWLAALSMADRALSIDPLVPEAQFNRAMILNVLGVQVRAETEWRKYLASDSQSEWSAIVRGQITSLPISESDAWKTATSDLTEVAPVKLVSLTRAYPEPARRFAETVYLAMWSDAVRNGRNDAALRLFEQIRIVAQTLERDTGETLLADSLRRIEREARPRKALLDGLTAYYEGRIAYSQAHFADAEKRLHEAQISLERAGCPLWKMAEFYRASSIGNQGKAAEARQLFYERVVAERSARAPHKAVLAHALYELSLEDAVLGHWSSSLAAATESMALFSAMHERQNAAAVYAVFAEDLEFLGDRERSLTQGVAGLRATCAVGDYDRARVMLATLCRTEMRSGEAGRALSLTSLEWEIAPLAPQEAERHDADMFLRRASAQWHLGKLTDARHSIELARTAANRPLDASLRRKLLADVDAAEGSFLRNRDPRRAVALLSSAIDFEHAVSRPIVLPALYLQRGRAYLAVNDLAAGERDFEAGLSELERQRTRVSEAELRPGIFDDASELFDEAIALQIRKGAGADAVLRQVERGRARAVLEQINAGDESFRTPELARIADVQRELDAKTAVLEFVALPERLVVFVIRRDRAVMKIVPVARETLKRATRAFADGRGANGGELYDALIAPIRSELEDVSAIDIVADDFLQRAPFGALFDRRSRTFLVQHYAIATSPSAGVFLATLAQERRLPSRRPNALVFANPTIPREQYGDLPSLSASQYEAPRIARGYARADVFTGDAATAERFRELAPAHDVVHFAGHGVINEREPYSSALVCAATPQRSGGVTAHDIARMRFRSTRVVVLAACSTLTGRNAAVEGVPSLARAFVVAGVPAVVGTLWDIEDSEAVAITRPLHEQLARGVAPAEALRDAQLAAIRKNLPPSQWSAFALMGSARALPVPARTHAELAAK
jgi:CHAT domain-containing protein